MSFKDLTPVEKKRLNRSISIVSKLVERGCLSEIDVFTLRERTRMVLKILGAKEPSKILIVDSIYVIKDNWPFKIRRLRKLINGQ